MRLGSCPYSLRGEAWWLAAEWFALLRRPVAIRPHPWVREYLCHPPATEADIEADRRQRREYQLYGAQLSWIAIDDLVKPLDTERLTALVTGGGA